MTSRTVDQSGAAALPPARLAVGVTGHRHDNAAFDANRDAIEAEITRIFDAIDRSAARQTGPVGRTRLLCLLAHGTDLVAVEQAFARDWDVVAPLPFGRALNIAINAHPDTADVASALIEGRAAPAGRAADDAAHIRSLVDRARCLELAEQDERVAALFLDTLRAPGDARAARAFTIIASERAATAGRVMIEQSDLLIGVWDGVTLGAVGGTRHTMAVALNQGVPVLWIDAAAPSCTRLLRTPEALDALHGEEADVAALVDAILDPTGVEQQARALRYQQERWRPRSRRRFHAYRRIEALFERGGAGFRGLTQRYERPEAIAAGSGAALLGKARDLPGGDPRMVDAIGTDILPRFARADGLSTYLSDAYRGGMVANFLLSALAIVGGVAYLPFSGAEAKWQFALLEFLLLLAIVAITTIGRRARWHGRWFETRRVAEYLRHAPMLLLLGVARTAGRWPRGAHAQWPETYVRLALRDVGPPLLVVTQAYLRQALERLLADYVRGQRAYHQAKAHRLARVHHNLDRLSELLFGLAVFSVALYLLLVAAGALGIIAEPLAAKASKSFTFLGVAFPTIGGALAGIRYFGDFERFAAISEVTAEKLGDIEERIDLLIATPASDLTYAQASGLAHAIDNTVIGEIESWQAVFAGKQISVPV